MRVHLLLLVVASVFSLAASACEAGERPKPVTSLLIASPNTSPTPCMTNAAVGGERVYGWGFNPHNELATSFHQPFPVAINYSTLDWATAVAANGNYSAAIANGIVYDWGWHSYYPKQVATNPGKTTFLQASAISVGNGGWMIALDAGSAWTWKAGVGVATSISGVSNVIAIAAGQDAFYALGSGGKVFGWGKPAGIAGTVQTPTHITGLDDVTAISAYEKRLLALKQDGTVWGVGPGYGQSPVQLNVSDVIAISAGDGLTKSVVVLTDGTVWQSSAATFTRVDGITKAVSVSATVNRAYWIDKNGILGVWGADYYPGQSVVGLPGKGISGSSQVNGGYTVDNGVQNRPVRVNDYTGTKNLWGGVRTVSAGPHHTLAVIGPQPGPAQCGLIVTPPPPPATTSASAPPVPAPPTAGPTIQATAPVSTQAPTAVPSEAPPSPAPTLEPSGPVPTNTIEPATSPSVAPR